MRRYARWNGESGSTPPRPVARGTRLARPGAATSVAGVIESNVEASQRRKAPKGARRRIYVTHGTERARRRSELLCVASGARRVSRQPDRGRVRVAAVTEKARNLGVLQQRVIESHAPGLRFGRTTSVRTAGESDRECGHEKENRHQAIAHWSVPPCLRHKIRVSRRKRAAGISQVAFRTSESRVGLASRDLERQGASLIWSGGDVTPGAAAGLHSYGRLAVAAVHRLNVVAGRALNFLMQATRMRECRGRRPPAPHLEDERVAGAHKLRRPRIEIGRRPADRRHVARRAVTRRWRKAALRRVAFEARCVILGRSLKSSALQPKPFKSLGRRREELTRGLVR